LVNGLRIAIPNVAGLSVERATAVLSAAGFSVRVANQPSATVPYGRVIGTNPGSSRGAHAGDRITLLVSTGAPVEPAPTDDDDDEDDEKKKPDPGDDPTPEEDKPEPPKDDPSDKPSKEPSESPTGEEDATRPPPEDE
jgi:hypothetical protein